MHKKISTSLKKSCFILHPLTSPNKHCTRLLVSAILPTESKFIQSVLKVTKAVTMSLEKIHTFFHCLQLESKLLWGRNI